MKAPRVTLDQWRTLQAVVDHGGFAQAAEALHRSQSSVSYTVARMQDQLGVPLLRIDGRKAVLTDAGEVLLRRSRQLVKNASQLEDLAHHMEQGWEAEVRLVVDAAYPNARLVRALTAFMPQSRGCRVRLREEVLSGVEELLMEGVADLAICGFSIPGYLGTEMSDVEFVAVAHPEHTLHRMNRELSFQDLESQMQVVIRDSGRQQPRDVGWLGAEQRWTVGSLATAAPGLCVVAAAHDRARTRRRRAQAATLGTGRQPPPDVLPVLEQGQTPGAGNADPRGVTAHV
ncbi:hypothetical protein ALP39_02665 [Pseudomonas marginalis pv. marginalis]|nr:hypothetical protein ALP39_02665 [Pseudomonas marginalis pv. marginalis]